MADDQTYPVICWPLGDDLVLGALLGTPMTVVRPDGRKVVAALKAELRRESVFLPSPTERARLLRMPVEVRPAWRTETGDFPLPDPVTVEVDVVHSELVGSGQVADLPRLGRRFYFDDPAQLETLTVHFAREELRALGPNRVLQMLVPSEPWLETVTVRPHRGRARETAPKPRTDRLDQIGERLPLKRRGTGTITPSAWERTDEVDAVVAKLLAPRGNVVVVGPPGSGKSQVLYDAVRKASRKDNAPPVWRTQAQRTIVGARYLGDWEELVEQLGRELAAVRGVLWVEDLATLIRIGGSGPEDSVAAFLVPLLDQGSVRLVSELTPRMLEVARGRLPGFVERFQIVQLAELSAGQVRRIVRRIATQSERDLGVTIEPAAQGLAYRLLDRHVRHERFPGKATALLADGIHDARQAGSSRLTAEMVLDRFIRRSSMPRDLLDDAVLLDPRALREHFASTIVGQPAAVDEVCRVVETFKAGLADPDRPLATLLFAGPTGVGKTAMAKALAGYFFGAGPEEAPLVRVDMSELQHEGQVHRLIGLGRDEPGPIVQQLRASPFGVVLFDEIEKAHPVFFDLLLTVLDEGILADALGRETDFRGRVLVLTTNLGSGGAASLGFGSDGVRHDLSAVRRFFRPEFFNRIDRVVQFGSLDRDSVRAIARIELSGVAKREGLASRGVAVQFTDALVDWVVAHGFDRDYGARALQRVVEQRVVTVIGRALLRAPHVRAATLRVDVLNDEVVAELADG